MTNEQEPQTGPVVLGPLAIHLPEDQDHPWTVPQDHQRTTSGPRTTFEPTDWEARLAEAVAKTLRERARKKQERAEFARRRAYGLIQRHGRKAARLRHQPSEEEPPCA